MKINKCISIYIYIYIYTRIYIYILTCICRCMCIVKTQRHIQYSTFDRCFMERWCPGYPSPIATYVPGVPSQEEVKRRNSYDWIWSRHKRAACGLHGGVGPGWWEVAARNVSEEVVKNEIFSSEYESMMLVSWKNSRFPRQLDKWFRRFVAFSYLFGPWILWSSGPFLLLLSGSLIHNTTPFSLVPFLRFTKHMCSNGGHNTSGNAVKPLLFLVGEGDICFQVLLGDRNQFSSRVCDSVPLLTHFWSSPLYPLGCGAKA